MKYSFEDFKLEFYEIINEFVHGWGKVEMHMTEQNNQVKKTMLSVSIRYCGKKREVTICLEDVYKIYLEADSFGEFKEHIFYVLGTGKCVRDTPSWQDIKEIVTVGVINYEWNKKRLMEMPHQEFLNLALVMRVNMPCEDKKVAGFFVTHNQLTEWGISEEDAWGLAWNNFWEENYSVENIVDLLKEADLLKNITDIEVDFPFVVSNSIRIYGAAGILRTDVLKDFADKKKCNFYILPSSVHEILLVPETVGFEVDVFRTMVREVNATVVREIDWLGEEIYFYDREKNCVEVVM